MPNRICARLATAVMLAACGAASGQFYEYRIVAKVGQAGLTGMGDGPSINRGLTTGPRVAFVGQQGDADDKWEGIFVGDGQAPPANFTPSLTNSTYNIAPSCQINEVGTIVSRWTSPNPNGPAYSHLWTWSSDVPDSGTKIADSVAQNPFRAINPDPTINMLGKVVWSGLDADVKRVLATGLWGNYKFKLLPTTPIRPMLAENSEITYRNGNATTDPILLVDPQLNTLKTVASNSDFTSIGRSPGICGDSNVIVFSGELSAGGAAALNASQANWDYGGEKLKLQPLTAGPGIFASVRTEIGRVIVRVAGVAGNKVLDPGETFVDLNGNGKYDPQTETDEGPCVSFTDLDARVAVDGLLDEQRAVTVCYVAQNAQGKQGLYTNRLNFFGTGQSQLKATRPGFLVVGQTSTVVEAGKTIPGLAGAVQSIGVYDQLNARDRGDVAFYAKTDSSAGIVLARPVQVVFLDFNPLQNFRESLASAGLFQDLGCDVAWSGNMDTVFWSLAPGRDDLNSPSALKAIQDGIVAQVQDNYDHMVANGPGLKVKVLGKVGEAAPTGGPFIRVWIGDGPNSNQNPSGIAGIAMLDLFNQKCFFNYGPNGVTSIVADTGAPLILVDNQFREIYKPFTNEDPNNLQAIPLSDTGPKKVTQSQVINCLAKTISHEVGHNLGLEHIDDWLDHLIMNAYISSVFYGHPTDENRYRQRFGDADESLEPNEHWMGTQHCAERLANSVGSDESELSFTRGQPTEEVLLEERRYLQSAPVDLNGPISVASAGIGIVPRGRCDAAPIFVNLGAGDLKSLLNSQFEFGAGDAVILVASTTGNGIDIFGVKSGFGGDVKKIDVSNGLLVMTDERLRSPITSADGKPLAKVLDIYQDKNGQRTKIGTMGDPAGNTGPVAKNDAADAQAGKPVVISVLANDSDPDGLDKATVSIVSQAPHGAAATDPATGKVTYRSEAGFSGVDTFRYTVRDTKGAVSNEATVTVTVTGGDCYADFDGNGTLDLFDFLGFVNAFNAQDQKADCIDDNAFDLFDFLCFVNAFNAGC